MTRRMSSTTPLFSEAETTIPRRREARTGVLRNWLGGKQWREALDFHFAGSDWWILIIVIGLSCFGILMIYSASLPGWYVPLEENLNYFALRQAQWLGVALAVMFVFWTIRYTFWCEWGKELLVGTFLMLALVLLVGDDRYGARRTLLRGSLQPSELAKVTMVLYWSIWLASKKDKLSKWEFGLVPYSFFTGMIVGLIIAEPDRSTSLLFILVGVGLFFMASRRFLDLIPVLLVMIPGALLVIFSAGYAQDRVADFLKMWTQPQVAAGGQVQGFLECFKSGGVFGTGLGAGQAKTYVIFPHSDGIFAVIGEEWGFLGAMAVIAAFALLARRGLRIARQAPDAVGTLIATGISAWFILQASMHIAVALGMVPATGLPLPFLSYGGSALVSEFAGVGLLLSISRYGAAEAYEEDARADVWGRHRRTRVSRAGGR